MKPNSLLKRSLAWTLIAALVNPAATLPVWAQVPPNSSTGDFVIYTSTASGGASEPNILMLIDTSDSMNIPEPWREYPGAYDSHTEYLWNDIGIIQNSEQTTEHASRISTAAQSATPFSKYGFWAGATLADRQALWTAAKNYANATEPGDPGARNTYRNYSNANWIHWLPAGTAETDARLRSPSFNRWAGGVREISGLRGGISFSNNDLRGYNKCAASAPELLPSTVFAPTAYAKNTGKYLNQEWQRWERWLDLRNGRAADGDTAYPTTVGSGQTPASGTYTIAAGSAVGTIGNGIRARDEFLGPPAAGVNPVRDSWPRQAAFSNGWTNIGERGQPIRTRKAGDRAGWTDLKADLGGFNFADSVNGYNSTVLVNTLTTYQATYYGNAPTTGNAFSLAWKGNRDQTLPVPSYDIKLGTPAYYDTDATLLRLNTGGGATLCTRTCTIDSDPGTGGNQAVIAATGNNDGSNTARYWVRSGASCQSTGTSGSDCSTLPAACGTPNTGSNFVNANRTGCAWSGRLSNYVEGEGTWYYGGTCSGSCRGEGYGLGAASCESGATSTSYCTAGGSTVTRNSIVMNNAVLGSATSNCSDNSDLSQNCPTREGVAGCYWVSGTDPCTDRTVTSGASTTDYFVHTLAARDDYLNHDCKADNGASGNPGNSYLSNQSNIPFNEAWSTAVGGNKPYVAANPGVSYPAVDMYSVNYLNWKFGPKGPNGHPIGRKTRLQIAKDALTDLVATTNGVRFGLMVFNKRDTSSFAEGGNIVHKMTTMGPKNCSLASPTTTASMTAGSAVLTLASNPGFGVGNAITVPGAGTAGGNLNATVLSVAGTVLVLSTAAGTTVSGVTVAVPPCSGSELTDYANRAVLIGKINNLVAASRTPLAESLYEAYRYFRGEAPVFGRLSTAAAAGGAVAAGCDKTAFATPGGGADCTGSSGNYVSPMASSLDPVTGLPAACQKNFVVLMTDGGPEDDFSANTAIKALSDSVAAGTVSPDTRVDVNQADTGSGQFEDAGLPYGPTDLAGTANDGGYIWLDELAYYMSVSDMNTAITGRQPVVTYTIGFAGANTPVLQQAATRSGGNNYVANDSDELAAALTAAVAAIREWNPTVSAPTVPLSALNRSESGEQVYLAFFGPSNSQAWSGTVKQFRFGEGETNCGRTVVPDAPIELCLVGKTVLSGGTVKNIEQVETDPITGEQTVVVNPAAVSFWNPANTQDGSKPNLGGSGQRLKDDGVWNPSTRRVFTIITDPGALLESTSGSANILDGGNAVTESNTALLTKSRLGNAGMSDATRSMLINFVRGGNPSDPNCADASAGTACTAWQTWPHYDVLHSRPALITYNPTPVADPEVGGGQLATSQVLFFLTNEGLLRAVDAKTGAEKWSFLLEETISRIVDIKNNLAGQHLTLADGAPAVWTHDANGDGIIGNAAGEKAYLFFGLRRGGRAYYGLDVTDVENPRLIWKITNTTRCSGVSCAASADFAEMGYAWSTPAVGRVRAIADPSVPAIIFGGGYDPNQDNAAISAADTMGRGVYIIRGDDSVLLKAFTHATTGGMDFSIPSDVAALNTDLDSQGMLDRIYVGDMAANVWRFDVNNVDPAAWTAKHFAALSDPFALPGTAPNRKILFPPSVVKQNFKGQRYDAVYIGTGDREHPLNTASVDKMFMLKDTGIGLAATADPTIAYPGNLLDITNSFTETDFNTLLGGTPWSTKTGWYMDFAAGEKMTSAPTVYRNILSFSTYSPNLSISACVPPGKGTLYGMSALDGSVVTGTYAAGAGVTAQQRRQYVGLAVRGYIPTGSLIVRGKKVFVVNVAEGRLLYRQIGTIGGASKVYWYRESER
ncbi:MAG: hypothetical protein EFKGCFLK_01966 [Rhodocyclaceae bacterium]|nr:MAG: hypothetical protein F9K21_03545 [Rhodocyclaceae bacterium]MBV6408379.1 hypothetical protein [Rhodocyclaceae bacterium]CAG0929771.1 Type IV pilus biogenesis factor PilY1 [Rhodocyclaceae bacterium]